MLPTKKKALFGDAQHPWTCRESNPGPKEILETLIHVRSLSGDPQAGFPHIQGWAYTIEVFVIGTMAAPTLIF